MKSYKGSLVMEALLSLWVIILWLSLLSMSLRLLSFKPNYRYWQDEVSLRQLKRELLLAKDFVIENHQLKYRIGKEEKQLSLIQEKLILQPGTQIFLEQIDSLSFAKEGQRLYLDYWIQDQHYRVCLYA